LCSTKILTKIRQKAEDQRQRSINSAAHGYLTSAENSVTETEWQSGQNEPV